MWEGAARGDHKVSKVMNAATHGVCLSNPSRSAAEVNLKGTEEAQRCKDTFSTLLVNWTQKRKITVKGNQKKRGRGEVAERQRDAPRLGSQKQKEDNKFRFVRAIKRQRPSHWEV